MEHRLTEISVREESVWYGKEATKERVASSSCSDRGKPRLASGGLGVLYEA